MILADRALYAMNAALAAVLAAFLLMSCTNQTAAGDSLITVLTKVANTAQADLTQATSIANAATPPDTDGVMCYTALMAVNSDILKVLNAGQGGGIIATAEVASLFQPGSIQYVTEQQKVGQCAPKAQDVLGPAGLLAAGGVAGAIAIGKVAPFLAAAP